jgi:hypothetical protein
VQLTMTARHRHSMIRVNGSEHRRSVEFSPALQVSRQ